MAHSEDTRSLPDLTLTVNMHVDSTKQFTTVQVTTFFDGLKVSGLGTAKRNVTDKYDVSIGGAISFARALRDLADAVEELAGEL